MSNISKSAFVLCAGKGTRMRPLTDHTPKPLVKIFDRPILEYIFDHLKAADIEQVTLNGHYKAEQIENYARQKSEDFEMSFSYEHDILETGGGIKKALYTMPQDTPFYVINGDAFWTEKDPQNPALKRLVQAWDDEAMDILLLLQPVSKMTLTKGVGDYNILEGGQIKRSKDQTGTHMFTGIRLVHARVFEFKSYSAFSFLECMDEAEASGRLYGLEHEGLWHHLSTPEDITSVEQGEGRG